MDQPPAVWRREEREKRAEKRKAASAAPSDGGGSDFGGDAGASLQPGKENAGEPATRARKKRKVGKGGNKATPPDNHEHSALDVDALEDGQADTNLDALASSNADNIGEDAIVIPTKKRRGRPPKKAPPRFIPERDLEVERDLEQEIGDTIRELEYWDSTFKEFENNDKHPVLVQSVQRARELTELHKPDNNVNEEEEIGDDEFEDDPDVANVLLTEEESRHKELVWIAANEDWLRTQQEKMLAKALEEAQGKPLKPKQRRQRNQMGDGSVLGGEASASPAESAMKMAAKRGGKAFSSNLNYEVIKGLFGESTTPSTQMPTPEGSATAGASPPAQEPEPQAAKAVETVDAQEEEEEDYEEEEEEEVEEYDEDLENEHNYDDDEGFGEDRDGAPVSFTEDESELIAKRLQALGYIK